MLAHRQLLEKRTQGKIDVYFMGNSITRRWGATDYPEFRAVVPDYTMPDRFGLDENGAVPEDVQEQQALADRDALIGQVITNLNGVLGPLDSRDKQLTDLITNLQAFISGLSQDREAIGASLVSIDDLAGTTASLLKEVDLVKAAHVALLVAHLLPVRQVLPELDFIREPSVSYRLLVELVCPFVVNRF